MIKIFLLITIVGAAFASEPRTDFIRTPELNGDLYFKTVSVGEVTTTLFALPAAYSCALNKELSFDAATTPVIAFTSLDNSTVVRLSGLKGRLTCNFRNMLLGTLGVRIPTGTNKFSGEELLTAGNVSSRQLGFSEGALYNSLDIFGSAAGGMVLKDLGSGDLSIGLGGSFLYKGSFVPTDVNDSVYYPGSEGNVSLALEYLFLAFERMNTLLLDFGVTMYGEDQYSGETFRRGNKLNWSFTVESSVNPKIPVSLRLANYIKGANENPGRFSETAKKANDLIVALQCGLPFALAKKPFASFAFSSFSGGGVDGYGDASIFSVGGGASQRWSEHLFSNGEVGVDIGSLEEQSVFGIYARMGLNFKF